MDLLLGVVSAESSTFSTVAILDLLGDFAADFGDFAVDFDADFGDFAAEFGDLGTGIGDLADALGLNVGNLATDVGEPEVEAKPTPKDLEISA